MIINHQEIMTMLLEEYKRPWKLITLLLGLVLLITGSLYFRIPDWDIPISFIMAILTYLAAPWSLRVIRQRQWKKIPLMLLYTWFTVDGCYSLYWHIVDPHVLETMREANFFASLPLYGLCGLFWYYQGSLKEFRQELTEIIGHFPR